MALLMLADSKLTGSHGPKLCLSSVEQIGSVSELVPHGLIAALLLSDVLEVHVVLLVVLPLDHELGDTWLLDDLAPELLDLQLGWRLNAVLFKLIVDVDIIAASEEFLIIV